MSMSVVIAIVAFLAIIGIAILTSFFEGQQSAKRNKERLRNYERLQRTLTEKKEHKSSGAEAIEPSAFTSGS